jgi:hypothetical protein
MSAMGRAIQSLYLVLSVMGGVVARAPALADSVPFWGAKASVPIDTPINQLKKGEFLWMGEAVTTGPVVMVILTPGATLFVTNEALYPQTSGPILQVVDADPPAKRQPVHSRRS